MAGTIAENAHAYFDEFKSVIDRLDPEIMDEYAEELFRAWRDDRCVHVFGNGGSSSCASHHVLDYMKTARVAGQRALRALSPDDNIGVITAVGNDISYEDVFLYSLEALAKPGDIAVAISCSGNSPNVVKALEWANTNGLLTVAITGFEGGKIGKMAGIHINIPSTNYGIIEDLQLSVGHIVAQALKTRVQLETGVRS